MLHYSGDLLTFEWVGGGQVSNTWHMSNTGEVKARDHKFQVSPGYHNKTLSKNK